MRRISFFIYALLLVVAASAQSPKAILEKISKYPNQAYPIASTYPSVPLGEIAPAPAGFEPFYFSLVGRHGSRYSQSNKDLRTLLATYRKADSLAILTDLGKRFYRKMEEITAVQEAHLHELTPLGYNQWVGIGNRAYSNFTPVFEGAIESKSSNTMRCVMSMVAFNQGLKEGNPRLVVHQDVQEEEQAIVKPLYSNPDVPELALSIHREYRKHGKWLEDRKAWDRNSDCSAFLSKITTDSERLLKECGAKRGYRFARHSFRQLLFAENFEMGDRELLNTLFTPEEMYNMYVYNTAFWVHTASAIDNDIVAMFASYMRPLIEDIMNGASDAIKGENPHCANSRFTHDTYMMPLFSVMGYEGCVAKSTGDLETDTTSFNLGELVSMAANLQIILYRNKQGKVLVRSLINERDAYLPIKSKTAPFYTWAEFSNYVEHRLKQLNATRDRVLKNHRP